MDQVFTCSKCIKYLQKDRIYTDINNQALKMLLKVAVNITKAFLVKTILKDMKILQ